MTAAVVEIGAAAVAFSTQSGNAAVQQGAKIFGGGLRVGAWYDGQDALENWHLERYSLAGVYALRATTQLGGATLSITIGLAYAKPYLEYLLKKHASRPILGMAVRSGLQASTALALRITPMLRLFFGLNIAIVALLLIEILLFPNQLQRYLDTGTFRKERKNNTFETEEAEMHTLQSALKGTL